MTLDLAWSGGKPTSVEIRVDRNIVARPVRVVYAGQELTAFKTTGGMIRSLDTF
jgi:alpha-L-fucosidase 2